MAKQDSLLPAKSVFSAQWRIKENPFFSAKILVIVVSKIQPAGSMLKP